MAAPRIIRPVAEWRPSDWLAAFCAVQVSLWTLAPALTHSAPPLDVVEMFVWGQERVIATYKHPNMPGLVLHAFREIFGGALWVAYLVSQACVALAFLAVYLLGCDLLGRRRALAGTLLLTGVFYYSWPTPEFNHNVLQIPFWAGICVALWKATRDGHMFWWILFGDLAGLSLWAKYSSGLLLLSAAAWILWDRRARACLASRGPWIALGVFAVMAFPQGLQLVTLPLSPLDYAAGRAAQGDGPGSFALAQVACHGAFLAVAAAAGLFGAGATRRSPEEKDARGFLVFLGLGPALAAVAAAPVLGLGLRDMWGMPMFNLSGLLLLAFLPGRFDDRVLGRLKLLCGVVLVTVPALYAARVAFRDTYSDRPSRVVWPQDEIAETLAGAYAGKVGTLPRIVAGPVWPAGLVALATPGKPMVLIDGDRAKAPWVSEKALARHGALAVWPAGSPPPALEARIAGLPVETVTFRWSAGGRPIRLDWTALPPRAR